MFLLQHHQSRHQDVNTLSEFIRTAANAQQHIWNALSVNHRNITATMVWLMTNAFMDATGPINFFTFAIQKVISSQPFFEFAMNIVQLIRFLCFVYSCRWFQMSNQNQRTSSSFLAISTIRNPRRQSPSYHMCWGTSTFDFMRWRFTFQPRKFNLRRT